MKFNALTTAPCFKLAVCAFSKSNDQRLNLPLVMDHFGDSILPYLLIDDQAESEQPRQVAGMPIIARSKIKYANVRPTLRSHAERHNVFPDSTLRGPRREIR